MDEHSVAKKVLMANASGRWMRGGQNIGWIAPRGSGWISGVG